MLTYTNPCSKTSKVSDVQCEICKKHLPYELVSQMLVNFDLKKVCGICALDVLKKERFESNTLAELLYKKTLYFLNLSSVVLSEEEQLKENKRIERKIKRQKLKEQRNEEKSTLICI